MRYCPNCAYDYERLADDDEEPADAVQDLNDYDESGRWIERDLARFALARWSLNCRSRLAGCLGAIAGLIVGALIAGLIAPQGSDPVLDLILVFGGAIIGMYPAAYLALSSAAR
jgi:hypothetical protein